MEKIEVRSINVEIKTISLGGKKLTKSIFNQIEQKDCFNKHLDFIGKEYFGYIKENTARYLIWNDQGKLRKTNISDYSNLPKLERFTASVNIEWFLIKCNIQGDGYDDNRGRPKIRLDVKAQHDYNKAVDKVKAFIIQILEHQIYI